MLKTKIESLLFISNKPLSVKELANFISKNDEKVNKEDVLAVIQELKTKYNQSKSGIQLIESGEDFQLVTNSQVADLVKKFIKADMTGELTPASLETLTVIAYRGPISKAELEQIRGVNCTVIIRNLLIRGLITEIEDKTKMQNYYQVTIEFLKFLGINSVVELPDFDKLKQSDNLEQFLSLDKQNVTAN